MKINIILLLIFLLSYCNLQTRENELNSENPYRASMLKELSQKVECIGCNPTTEELLAYYHLRDTIVPHKRSEDIVIPTIMRTFYYKGYFLYFPDNMKNPWVVPGSGGYRNRGMLYPGQYRPYRRLYY